LEKQGFCKKNTTPQIFSAKQAKTGWRLFLQNRRPTEVATEVQTLLFQNAVKKFAADKDE